MKIDEAKRYIIQHCNPDYPNGSTEWETAMNMAIEALQQPKIVRCRDCKHRRADTMYSYCEKLYRMGVSDIYYYMTSDDDFCSMAERR